MARRWLFAAGALDLGCFFGGKEQCDVY